MSLEYGDVVSAIEEIHRDRPGCEIFVHFGSMKDACGVFSMGSLLASALLPMVDVMSSPFGVHRVLIGGDGVEPGQVVVGPVVRRNGEYDEEWPDDEFQA